MKYSLTSTPQTVVNARSHERYMRFSAGKFSTAESVYITFQGSQNVIQILDHRGTSDAKIKVPAGRTLEAYTNTGTADLAVTKDDME